MRVRWKRVFQFLIFYMEAHYIISSFYAESCLFAGACYV